MSDVNEPKLFDACFIGGSLLNLLYAHKLALSGKRVIVVDSNPQLGGAWRSATVMGHEKWENAPHFFTVPRCVNYVRQYFPQDAIQPVANNLYLDWQGNALLTRNIHSEIVYHFLRNARALVNHVAAFKLSSLPRAMLDIAGGLYYSTKQKWYLNQGSGKFVDYAVCAIDRLGGEHRVGCKVERIREAAVDGEQVLLAEGNGFSIAARKIYLTRHSIVRDIAGSVIGDDDFSERNRTSIFLQLSEPPARPFYLLNLYNDAPFSFITNTSAIFHERVDQSQPIISLMVQNEGFLEDFGDKIEHGRPATAPPTTVPQIPKKDPIALGDAALARLIEAGLFRPGTAILRREAMEIPDSSYSRSTLERVKSLRPGRICILDTADAAALMFRGMPIE